MRLCPECYQRTRQKVCPACQVATIEDTTREGLIERILRHLGVQQDDEELIGQVIDHRYRVIELIGVGGMGEVYRASHLATRHDVALKVMKSEFAGQEEFVRRFFREARAVSGLVHPNIVKVSDFGQIRGGRLYLSMEFLRGRTLRSELVSPTGGVFRGMDPRRAIRIAIEVAKALGAAHQAGVIHRDLKPENIYVIPMEDDELVKVVDFGISKIGDAGGENLTSAGIFLGTPMYASPEQARGRKLDGRSDLYSLGVVLYEMLCGTTPFTGRDKIATLIAHINEPPPRLTDQKTEFPLPLGLPELVHRLLKKDPNDRFTAARHLIRALNDILSLEVDFDPEKTMPLRIKPSLDGSLEIITPAGSEEVTIAGELLDSEKTVAISTSSRVPVPVDTSTPPSVTVEPYPPPGQGLRRGMAAILGGLAGALVVGLLFVTLRGGPDWGQEEEAVRVAGEDSVNRSAEDAAPGADAQGGSAVNGVPDAAGAADGRGDDGRTALPTRCRIEARSVPDGAEVTIDGAAKGRTPVTLEFDCGSVPSKVTLRKRNYLREDLLVPRQTLVLSGEYRIDARLRRGPPGGVTRDSCPPGLVWDRADGKCIVPTGIDRPCAPGQARDRTGRCVRQETPRKDPVKPCRPGLYRDRSGRCVDPLSGGL